VAENNLTLVLWVFYLSKVRAPAPSPVPPGQWSPPGPCGRREERRRLPLHADRGAGRRVGLPPRRGGRAPAFPSRAPPPTPAAPRIPPPQVLDFADTVFIILQGNWSQFTFLHIFHHFSIFAFYWLNVFAGYDGDIWFTIVANGTIHAVMYYYYTLTTLGAKPWWKPLVTYAQMLQFLAMMTQAAFLYADPDCGYPKLIAASYFFYILFLFVLFAQFAAGAYCRASRAEGKAKAE